MFWGGVAQVRSTQHPFCRSDLCPCSPPRAAGTVTTHPQASFLTFSSLAPPDAAAREMSCSCLTLSLKSDTHWMTVMPAGTV